MTITQLRGLPFYGVPAKRCERRVNKWGEAFALKDEIKAPHLCHFVVSNKRGLRFNTFTKCCGSIFDRQTSEYSLNLSSVEERLASNNGSPVSKGIYDSTGPPIQSRAPSVQNELLMLSLPAIAGQAIEPLAQLMETAYVGRLGPLELASAGVSMSIFNILSKVFNIPLLSVATSFVAEDISRNAGKSTPGHLHPDDEMAERKALPSVSTALVLAAAIGVFEALAMYLGSGIFLNVMGIPPASPMRISAERFLKIRAIGAPAVVVYLAIQGIFRGFKDTKTPVLCLGFGNFSAVLMFPLLMYYFGLGVTGAAISTVVSQYVVAFLMIWYLNKKTILSLPNIQSMDFGGYLSSGGFLLGRTLAAVMTITLSTSMAARQGALAMAAHQICLQVWLSVSLLADAQAASGQALIASSCAKGDYRTVKEITFSALKTGLITGISLAIILGVSFSSIATMFTKDAEVLAITRSGLLFVSASQPINALAYIFDGLHYGISDFSYAAWSMMTVGAISSAFILYAPSVVGLSGVWSGLTLFMGLRTVAGYMRLISKNGPWWFLQEDIPKNWRLDGGIYD
ncbi:PROTEIN DETOXIFICATION [Salix koriyanagi]|uniref:Protein DETOXIFICATION n=1 Tax=Salix koriyanagi TaxID=2511006 RepID=A0A9Q0SMB0_9ROSI|nr:PROTEIN DETOXIFICATION [Salix koriyanagi]